MGFKLKFLIPMFGFIECAERSTYQFKTYIGAGLFGMYHFGYMIYAFFLTFMYYPAYINWISHLQYHLYGKI